MEKRGVPTVTVVTSPFEEQFKATVKEQGVTDMACVVVPHPIGGLNFQGIQQKAQASFPDVLKALQDWQPQENRS